jgi:hypothetical protein
MFSWWQRQKTVTPETIEGELRMAKRAERLTARRQRPPTPVLEGDATDDVPLQG